ncbi:hypothetical protein ACQCWA_00105 [Rossellomorea aquimaris]|uniref:hypothetical protein n=1 Tax=Rossellomorea aquimaris TaxID=189382 RepID=UPI003CECFADA
MNIINYSPKSKQIRFFRNIKRKLLHEFRDQPEMLMNFWDPRDFMSELKKRQSKNDAVIISAHGWEDSILRPNQGTFEKTITINESNLFKNKFVFANSCYTARKFGPNLVREGTFTYVGFDDSISDVFLSENNYKSTIELIIKKVYTLSIAEAITSFIKKCLTAKEFCEYIDFHFRKNINAVNKMSIKELNKQFQISIPNDSQKLKSLIKLEFIEKSKILKGKISLLGEENYINWKYIHSLSEEELYKRLEKIELVSDKNLLYKLFIKATIFLVLDDKANYLKTIQEFSETLEKEDDSTELFELPYDLSGDFDELKDSLAG